MSGIAAVLASPRGIADPEVLAQMLGAMESRGSDGVSSWHRGSVALGFLALHTTPESQRERQPLVVSESGLTVVFDGRVDNRDELMEAIGGAVSLEDGDAAFAAAAYERWGVDAATRLIGDFSFAIWDSRARRLFCARDVMGVRPFCYARAQDGTLLVASEIRALLATGLVDDRINEARALEFLCERRYHSSETLYTGIARLRPAHALVAEDGRAREVRYWDFDPRRTVRYRRDEDYVDHARQLLDQSIRAQARSVGRVGILLSGGVDSSSVAALTAAGGIDCEAFSVVFPGRACDEAPFIRAVTEHCGIPSTTMPYEPSPEQWYEDNTREYRDLGEYPNGVMLYGVRGRAAASGVRVLFTGCGGDDFFAGSRFHYADWLQRLAVGPILRQLASDVVARGPRRAASDFAMCGVWHVSPPSLRRAVKRVVGRNDRSAIPDWICADAAARTNLADRIGFGVVPHEGETFAQADIRTLLSIGVQAYNEETDDRAMFRDGVEYRHPLYDRRIMEFAYGMPEEQRWRGRTRKRLLRAAVPELPDVVRSRPDKAEFSDVYTDTLRRFTRTAVPHLCERGWIDPDVFRRMHTHLREATAAGEPLYWLEFMPVWMMFAVECWLEQTMTRSRYDRRTETAAFA